MIWTDTTNEFMIDNTIILSPCMWKVYHKTFFPIDDHWDDLKLQIYNINVGFYH